MRGLQRGSDICLVDMGERILQRVGRTVNEVASAEASEGNEHPAAIIYVELMCSQSLKVPNVGRFFLTEIVFLIKAKIKLYGMRYAADDSK